MPITPRNYSNNPRLEALLRAGGQGAAIGAQSGADLTQQAMRGEQASEQANKENALKMLLQGDQLEATSRENALDRASQERRARLGLERTGTPAQHAAETAAGKQIADYEVAGGQPVVDKNIAALESAKAELVGPKAKRDTYDRVVGGLTNSFPSIQGLIAPTEKERRDRVRETVRTLAKATDPNPTEKQIEIIMGQVYDPSSDSTSNASRIDRYLTEVKGKRDQIQKASENYHTSGYATKTAPGAKTLTASPKSTKEKGLPSLDAITAERTRRKALRGN